jgi:hypothetical protein
MNDIPQGDGSGDDDYYDGISETINFLSGFVTGAATRLARTKAGKKSQNVYVLIEPGGPAVLGIHIVSDKNKIGELRVKLSDDEAVPIGRAMMMVDAFIDHIEKEEKPNIEEKDNG